MNAAGRRATSWLNVSVLALSLTACCVLAVLMGTRTATRIDATVTRQHDLSARTRQALSRLDRNLTLLVAADLGTLDRATRQRTLDVLERFSAASARLKVTLIDTTSAEGQRSYERALSDLAQREKPTVDAAAASVGSVTGRVETLAGAIERLEQTLLSLKTQQVAGSGSLLSEQWLSTQAARLHVSASDLKGAVSSARAAVAAPDQLVGVPAIDRALAVLRGPVAESAKLLNELADGFDSLAKDPAGSGSDKAAAAAALPGLRAARDNAGTASTDLAGVAVPRVLKIARALQLRRAALLIDDDARPGAGPGITAIDVEMLLAAGGQGVDLRARTEDLVTGAIATLCGGVRPLVCIVHGAPTRLSAADWPGLQAARQALSLRGIEMIEWPVALEREMPAQAAADAPGRPVVFVTITASSGRAGAQALAAGIAAYSRALNGLIADGRNVLLSVNLSQVPSTGSPDPLTECLKPLGVEVDSGRPVLQSEKVQARSVALPWQTVLEPGAAHPVSGAMNDLKLLLQWPLAVSASNPAPGVRFEAVVTVPADGTRWAESEWQLFYEGVNRLKGDFTRIENPPAKDSPRDGAAGGERWTLAAAVERTGGAGLRQRVLVVGSNGWFLDDVTRLRVGVDGRETAVYPGNLQLLESGVQWLAGQDDQIQRGAVAASTPTIPALSGGQVSWLRWLLIAIMPALALAAGAAYRALRP